MSKIGSGRFPNSEIAAEWITKAMALSDGESISILCYNRREQSTLKKALFEYKEFLTCTIYAKEMAKITISGIMKNRQFFVVLKKGIPSTLEGFVQDQNGVKKVIEISNDLGKTRRIRLMIEDGYSLNEIEECEGSLNEEELLLFYPSPSPSLKEN